MLLIKTPLTLLYFIDYCSLLLSRVLSSLNVMRCVIAIKLPVPNSKCVSVLGQYKCNSSSLLNHRLIHVTFLTCNTCVQSDFTMVRLGPSVKIKFSTGIDRTRSCSVDNCSPFCATRTVGISAFAPLIYA